MQKYNKLQQLNLKEGQKITIVSQNAFGFLYTYQTTFILAEPKPHFVNCPESYYGVKITHKPKGKRKPISTTISHNSPLFIYNGWIDIDINSLQYDIEEENGMIIQTSKYGCFDPRLLEDLKTAYPDAILAS